MSCDVALEGHPLVLVTLGLLVLIRQGQKTGQVVRAFHQYPLEVVDPVLRLGSSLQTVLVKGQRDRYTDEGKRRPKVTTAR